MVISPAAAEEVHLVPAVYVFGDSTVDVGNLKYLPGNFTPPFPYGIDFPLANSSSPNGRFSNGYNLADCICTYAQALLHRVFKFDEPMKLTEMCKLKCSEAVGLQEEPAGVPVADAGDERSDPERLRWRQLRRRWIRHSRHHRQCCRFVTPPFVPKTS